MGLPHALGVQVHGRQAILKAAQASDYTPRPRWSFKSRFDGLRWSCERSDRMWSPLRSLALCRAPCVVVSLIASVTYAASLIPVVTFTPPDRPESIAIDKTGNTYV